jgi:signal transduction histidine kinase
MLDSLRARLLLWYSAILALVIAVFAATACYLYWRSLIGDVDRELGARAATLTAALRPAASGDFDLDRPPEFSAADTRPTVDYVVWTAQGELVDRSDPDGETVQPRPPGLATRSGRRELAVAAAGGATIMVGRDLGDVRRAVLSLAGMLGAAGSAALALSLVGGWLLVGRAVAPVLQSTERQRRFTADASHELRTPLATLTAELDWALARERPATEYRQALETCRRAAQRMRRTAEGLLALTRGDAHPLRAAPTRLDGIVTDTVALLRPMAARRQVHIDTRLEPVLVSGDRDRLTDLVTNLIANAIEYNREGGRVQIDVVARDAGCELQVSDTGIGIAAGDLPHVFERFYRADPSRARAPGGAGLGLAIARSITEAHRGAIECRSTPGEGTAIVVRLPRAS